MSSDWRNCLRRNYPALLEHLDTNNGLQGSMRKYSVLIPLIIKRLWEISDETARVSELLDQIVRGDDTRFSLFCDALMDCGQASIVTQYLKTSCPRQSDVTDATAFQYERPLSDFYKRQLSKNWNEIADLMESDVNFLQALENDKVLTKIQVKRLKNMTRRFERNEEILRLLEKTSEEKFHKFLGCSMNAKQSLLLNFFSDKPVQASGSNSSTQTLLPFDYQKQQPVFSSIQEGASVEESSKSESSSPIRDINLHPAGDSRQETRSSQGANFNPTSNDRSFTAQTEVEQIRQIEGIRFSDDGTVLIVKQRVAPVKYSEVDQLVRNQEAYAYRCDETVIRGHAVIIANEIFTGASNREGTETDIKNLTNLFEYLNFKVFVYRNQTAQDMLKVCEEHRDGLDEEHKAFILCLLSHGGNGTVQGTDDKEVYIEAVLTMFDGKNCKTLRNKPKIFIVQACQGNETTEGVPTDQSDAKKFDIESLFPVLQIRDLPVRDQTITDNVSSTIHEKADMIVLLASYPGYVAWRNPKTGSYFIQHVTDVFSKNAHAEHLADMATKVVQRVTIAVMNGKFKQVCSWKTTLTKKVFLLPF